MATPYTINMTLRAAGKRPKPVSLSASDVAGEFWLWPSGSSDQVQGNFEVAITDIVVSSAAGTTKNFQVFRNGNSIIDTMPLANFVGTIVKRPINESAPLIIPAGGTLKFKQLA